MSEIESMYELRYKNRWGSFGDILICGFFWDLHVPEQYELIRTGPFVPPFSFPSLACVVTDTVRQQIETTQFGGHRFTEMPLGKVVESDWDQWNLAEELDYSKLPDHFYEPEDLILNPEHRADLQARMPKLWQLKGASVTFHYTLYTEELRIVSRSQSDFVEADFVSPTKKAVVVSKRAKELLQDQYAEWIEFAEVIIET